MKGHLGAQAGDPELKGLVEMLPSMTSIQAERELQSIQGDRLGHGARAEFLGYLLRCDSHTDHRGRSSC